MNLTPASLMVGLLAGFAAALLSISAGEPSALSIILFAAATLPILIASLGWSNVAGFVAVIAAFAVVALVLSPMASLAFAATALLPAAWIGHLANLARPAEEIGGPEGSLAWYPLSDILFQLACLVCVSLVVLGYAIGYGETMMAAVVDQFIDVMSANNADFQPGDFDRDSLIAVFTSALPAVQSALWVGILIAAFYVASLIVRISGRERRPRDDYPATLRMPRQSLFVFAGGLALTFVGGVAGLIGAVVCGAFATAFTLAGFASLHHRTRGKSWRGAVLTAVYAAVFLFSLPALFLLVTGMLETARTVPVTGRPGSGNDNHPPY